jgi:DNA repair exonuclease SbcCD nuclease subunit
MKPIAIIFSDLHMNIWSKFNEGNARTLNHFKVLSCVRDICIKHHIPALFFGDFFHKADGLSIELLELMDEHLSNFDFPIDQFRVLSISGNHDLKLVNTIKSPKYSLVKYLSNRYSWFNCIDFMSVPISSNVMVHGVPYIDHNIGLTEYLKNLEFTEGYKNILLLHTDYPGAKDTDGREIDSVENLNINTLNRFDLVLCGHIHKPQRLSKKVYMIGAPLQQRRTDAKCKLGYWKLYPDLTLKFIELEGFPKFIDVESSDEIKEDGNYYTVLPKNTRVQVNAEHNITKQLSKKSLAKQYMKERGISDKKKKKLLIDILNKAESC